MARLFHGFGEIAGAQTVGGEFTCIKTCHLRALLDDPVDGAGFQCLRGNIAPAVDLAKHAALVDPRCFEPPREGVDGSSGQIGDLIGDRHLFDELFCSQAGNFAAATPTGGKGHHQDGLIA